MNGDVIRLLQPKTNITSFHMSGKKVVDSPMFYRKEDVHMGIKGLANMNYSEQRVSRFVRLLTC